MDILTYGLLNKKIEEAKNVSGEKITEAVNDYLNENPPTTGATAEQSAQITENKNGVSELKEDIETNFHINGNVKPNLVVGSFVNATDNSIGASSNFSMTAPIAVKKGQKVTLTATGYNKVVGMIATCNADNTERVTVVASVDSNEHDYIYNVTEDGYIVCSFNHNHDHKIAISLDYYSLFGDVDALEICQVGTIEQFINKYIDRKFVDLNGNIQSSDNFFISQSINLYSGQTISVSTRGYNTAIISEYDADTDTYKPLVIDTDHAEHNYTYTANKSMTIRCTIQWYGGGQQLSYSASITTSHIVVGAVEDAVDNKTADPLANIQYPQMFANIICMGDSLTRGESGGSQSVQLATNYPFYFEKLTQADVTNQSQGGITAQGFWNTFASTYDYAPFDCAVIFLGTNGGLTDTVETDCDVDYTQNADTNTGCYGKIIGRIKATAPNCKIFCVAGVNDYIRRATTMNPAVRALAEFYNVGLIDVENCIMSDSGGGGTAERYLYRPIDGIHYNRLGYMTLANMIYDSMSDFMSKHLTMYDD